MTSIAADSPLGQALQERVAAKLMELGWSTGEQDDTLSEYIILMLANGNEQTQIATELRTDLLNSEADDPAPDNFAAWLFEQVNELQRQFAPAPPAPVSAPAHHGGDLNAAANTFVPGGGDAEMGEGADDGSGTIPTGPKSMRNGPKGSTREKRMVGSINKNLDRSTDVLHRVRGGAGGAGRINSHGRDPPKGPRQTNIQRNLAAAGAGRGMMPPQMQMPGPGPMGQMSFGAQPNGNGQMVMDGNQMQQMLHMLERQAQMMAQMSNNMQPGQTGYQNGNRSFNDRVEKRGRFQNRRQDGAHQNRPAAGGDAEMGEDGQVKTEGAEASENTHDKPVEQVMCRYNKLCKNADCPYAHSGPLTFTGIVVDTTSDCTHGAACTNNRCSSRHPSPAKKHVYQSTVPCKFGPYCQKPGCTFSHPPEGPCKNGADCTDEGCKYWHNPVMCKYPQCTNKACPYKHAPGQKRGYYRSNQLVVNGDAVDHVSERQFSTVGEGEEELIAPGVAVKDEGMDVIA